MSGGPDLKEARWRGVSGHFHKGLLARSFKAGNNLEVSNLERLSDSLASCEPLLGEWMWRTQSSLVPEPQPGLQGPPAAAPTSS